MTALYSVKEIRDIEQAAQAALPQGTLMQRAGQAGAKAALALIPNPRGDAKVLVLAGPGNNGGDALEVASRLAQVGVQVTILLYADPGKQSQDAQQAYTRAQNSSANFSDPIFLPEISSTRWTLVVDGLYGIGLTRAIAGTQRSVIEFINSLPCPLLALDVPSGLDADTGNIVGQHGIAVRASHTITFIGNKPGLHTCYGRDFAGEVQVAKLDIENKFFMQAHAQLNDIKLFSGALQRRLQNSHKGSYGDVAIIGGAHGMSGAPIIAARTAAQCGAGRVFAVFVDTAPAYDSAQPELMCRSAREFDFSSATLVVGPGLGMARDAHDFLAQALNANMPLVIDADALNLIAVEPGLKTKLAQRRAPTLMTPHPLEAARLLAISSSDVQADRLTAARTLAQQCNAIIILKGSGTVIARADGNALINTTGNPGLATAGAGDVLSGICGALLAQHWPIWEAAAAAVWLHGHAADVLIGKGVGPIGLTASELIPEIRSALNQLTMDYASRHA
ncbi:MAG: NAD(P)H-hydrate dehydratase [Burkholderiaceae bacterium]